MITMGVWALSRGKRKWEKLTTRSVFIGNCPRYFITFSQNVI
jgi:hypothetical protein